ENHMPEVIVIDEIGTELEAQAARTIAERGVQLVGTAHGRTLDNLLLNPTLADLVGGIQAVTLGDEEARRRGTQKTVLERKAPPTFDVLVEQEERHLVGIHLDLASAVDELLRGEAPQRQMRERLPDGSIREWKEHAPRLGRSDGVGLPSREAPTTRVESGDRRGPRGAALGGSRAGEQWWERRAPVGVERAFDEAGPRWLDSELARGAALVAERDTSHGAETDPNGFRKRRIYPFGVSRVRLDQVIRELGLPAVVSRDERDADALLVLKSMYRKQPDRVDAAQASGIPIYVLRSGGLERLRETLSDMFHVARRPLQAGDADGLATDDFDDEEEPDDDQD
ncbi:MAG TPA: AAA family ATPase, partial [Ktedonobacterales bacterium]